MSIDPMIPPGMGRCEVTGNLVREDELVVIHGQRVCAEGKAILLERLQAGEALPGENERPTVLRRFGCLFVDGLVLGVCGALIGFVVGIAGGAGNPIGAGMAALFSVVIGVIYFTLMHGTSGQSLGKMAGKLKVVRLDGQPMNMQTAFIRAIGYQGTGIVQAIAIFPGVVNIAMAGNGIAGIYGLANVIVALVDRSQQRAIHDRIAGTRVVVVNK